MKKFEIKDNAFCMDGQPFRILSGAMHYFRIHPFYWEDRIKKMQIMGLNTLETYVAWNLHEPRPGKFVFNGWMDLVKYIKIAYDVGLNVIVRPGPYICAEWDLGGLPSWLLKDPYMKLRCSYTPYLKAVDRFFDELLPRLTPLLVSNGGPIIAMQIENEYGSYGNDKLYLKHLENKIKSKGINILLFTSDNAGNETLKHDSLPDILKTINFGSHAIEQFNKLRKYQTAGPLMCMEFWNGWFDHWGEQHHTRKLENAIKALDEILSSGASINFYMFHGGTNFNFMNGANCEKTYNPTITSYDYDAPLNEHGDITPKFKAFQKVISKYHKLPDIPMPAITSTMSIKSFELNESVDLLSSLNVISSPIKRCKPEPMEFLDQSYGFILYKTQITGPITESLLTIRELHDRGHVFIDGKLIGILEREFSENKISLTIPAGKFVLEILVENMGRINYGNKLHDRKGITDCVILGQQNLNNWTIYPLPLDNLSVLKFNSAVSLNCPGFYRGNFHVTNPQDSFLFLKGWTKGVCWINGFNIGKYWKRGPQQTLYVPKPLFKKGENEVLLLELDSMNDRFVEFCDKPILT